MAMQQGRFVNKRLFRAKAATRRQSGALGSSYNQTLATICTVAKSLKARMRFSESLLGAGCGKPLAPEHCSKPFSHGKMCRLLDREGPHRSRDKAMQGCRRRGQGKLSNP